MSLQAIIDQHANNMVARHNQIEEMISDQAATRANEIGEKAKAITDAFEQSGTALGSAAGAYHLGRSVYRAYKAKGLKGAAKRLAEKARQAKGDLKNIKDDDGEEDDAGETGEGDAPTGTGDAPTGPIGTSTDDPEAIGNRLDNLLSDARNQASQPTEANEEANQSPADPAGEQGEAEAAEPQQINLGDPETDPQAGNLNFAQGTVDEPEDLQVARWSDMAERVSARNAARGLDIEGNPLPEGVDPDALKPAERVLADVTKRAQAPSGQPAEDPAAPEPAQPAQPAPEPAQPAAPEPAEGTESDFLSQAQRPEGKLFDDAPAPSDEPLSAPSTSQPNIESSAADDAAKSAANDAENVTSKISSAGKSAVQETTNLTENISSKVGSGLDDAVPELLEAALPEVSAIPVLGEVAGLGLGLYGLFESIFGKKPDAGDEKKIIPVAPSASGIDPTQLQRATDLS